MCLKKIVKKMETKKGKTIKKFKLAKGRLMNIPLQEHYQL